MSQAKKGDKVSFRFTATTDHGINFSSTPEGEFLEITLGEGQMLPIIEDQLIDMAAGEQKKISVSEEDSFPRDEQLIFKVERKQFPEDLELVPNTHLQLRGQEGQEVAVMVVSVDDESVILDSNPPFVGHPMEMTLELSKIH